MKPLASPGIGAKTTCRICRAMKMDVIRIVRGYHLDRTFAVREKDVQIVMEEKPGSDAEEDDQGKCTEDEVAFHSLGVSPGKGAAVSVVGPVPKVILLPDIHGEYKPDYFEQGSGFRGGKDPR